LTKFQFSPCSSNRGTCTLNWYKIFNCMQFKPHQITRQISAPKFSSIIILVLGFVFVQLDPQLTIKLLIFFNFDIWFHQFLPSKLHTIYKLIIGFEFLQSNPESVTSFFTFKPLIWPIKLFKVHFQPPNFNFFQLTPKLTLKKWFSLQLSP
jgi:hypothetical protein